ncbi:MAG: IPT/TIG domain-containing protein [Planctomycetes bacterium]|nr:IPT/TIG domain-containing protein [Planctomycetota bacterium]
MHGSRGQVMFMAGAVALAGVLTAGCDGSRRRGWAPSAPEPAPQALALSPESGSAQGGASVAITATPPLDAAAAQGAIVRVGGQVVEASFQGGALVFTLPPAPGGNLTTTLEVTLELDGQVRTVGTFTYQAVLPVVASVSPAAGSRGGGTSLVITGEGFAPGCTVTIGGAPALELVISSGQLTCLTPSTSAVGGVDVVVTHPTAGAVTSAFTYTNAAPSAPDAELETDEDEALAIVVKAKDADGDALTYTLLDGPAHGQLSGALPQVTYTPDADWSGEDGFTFEVSDGLETTGPIKVTITVHPVNDAPVAEAQELETAEDKALKLTLGGSDVEDDELTFEVLAPPAHGALSGTPPKLIYTPEAGFSGEDAFTFVAKDGALTSEPATVTITVHPLPTVASLDPDRGPVAGGTAITIKGANFQADAEVAIGGEPCADVVVVDEETITCTSPAGVAGPAEVIVTNAAHGAARAVAGGFFYEGLDAARAVASSGGTQQDPAVAVGGAGILHVAFADRRGSTYDMYYRRSLDAGLTWVDDLRMNQSGVNNGHEGHASIAAAGSTVLCVWQDRRDGNDSDDDRDVYLRRSTDGGKTWASEGALRTGTSSNQIPSVAIDGSLAVVVYSNGSGSSSWIRMRRSTNGGSTWASETTLPSFASDRSNASVVVRGQVVLVTWEGSSSNAGVYVQRSADGGQTWGSAVRLSANSTNHRLPALAISGDLALCAWSDETSGSRRILLRRSVDGGQTWADATAAATTTGRSTPRLAAAGDTVLLVHGATGTNGLFLRQSADGGKTFGDAITLDAQARAGAVDLRDGHAVIGYATGSPTKIQARYGAFAP